MTRWWSRGDSKSILSVQNIPGAGGIGVLRPQDLRELYRHFKRKPCTTMVQYLIGFQRWHWAGEAQTFAEQQRPRS